MRKSTRLGRACKTAWRGVEWAALIVAGAAVIAGMAALFFLAPLALGGGR